MIEIKALEKLRDCTWIGGGKINEYLDEIQAEVDSNFAELEGFAKRVEDAVNNCEDLTLFGRDYMLLPVDADGVPIHVGDIMEGVDKYDTLRNVKGEVIEIGFHATDSEGLVASVALQVWAPDGKSWHRSYIDPYANVYRHVKPRTLEDVLEEFASLPERIDRIAAMKRYADEIRELLEKEVM